MKRELYAPASATAVLLCAGRAYQRERVGAADMITVAEAASFMGVDSTTIATLVRKGHCLGVAAPNRTLRLPGWQFEPPFWFLIQPISECLGTKDGWQMLNFLETPLGALKGLTPRVALEQGASTARILELATAHSH